MLHCIITALSHERYSDRNKPSDMDRERQNMVSCVLCAAYFNCIMIFYNSILRLNHNDSFSDNITFITNITDIKINFSSHVQNLSVREGVKT